MKLKISGRSLDKLCFSLVVLDLMFFPYIRFLSLSLSMLLIPVWFFFRGSTLVNDRDLRLSVVAIFLCVLSFLLSFVLYQDGFLLRDGSSGGSLDMLANTVIIIFMFLYYVFFKSLIVKYHIEINKYLILYLFFILLLAFVFYLNPKSYFEVRSVWTMYENVIEVGDFSNTMYRFTGTLSEPNNLAAICVSILAFIVLFRKVAYNISIPLFLLVLSVVLATMSTSGVFYFIIVFIAFIINDLMVSVSDKRIVLFKVFLICLFVSLILSVFLLFQETTVGKVSSDRFEINSMDSRYLIWMRSIDFNKIMTSFLWGDGGLVVMAGRVINPHNGHLHLIYSYGFLFYITFVYMYFAPIFSKPKLSDLFLVPLFLCFTINVGIYELRFAGLMALLVAASNASKVRFLRV